MPDDPSHKPTIRDARTKGPPPPEEIAGHFPQLDSLEILGIGGMGVVYKARQTSLDRVVAVKILPPEPDRGDNFAERFGREARALARLHHPNIVMVYDSGHVGDIYYFIMEYVDGMNLRQMMSADDLDARSALTIVPQVCEALQYAHEEGIVHRDIKPENILIDRKGRVKIADFGLAKLVAGSTTDYTLTAPRQAMGTVHYMAPEQVERPAEVDHRADIYSLGVVIYELLTGELPIGRFPLPSEKSQCDRRLDEIVLRTLEKDPDRRYQTVVEVGTDVETVCGTDAATPPASAAGTASMPVGNAASWGSAGSHVLTPQPGGRSASVGDAAAAFAAADSQAHQYFPRAAERIRGPAASIFLSGVLSMIVAGPTLLVLTIMFLAGNAVLLSWGGLAAVCMVTASVMMLLAGGRMKRFESRRLSVAACILAMTPITLVWWWLTIWLGIWGLIALNNQEVRAAYAFRAAERRSTG